MTLELGVCRLKADGSETHYVGASLGAFANGGLYYLNIGSTLGFAPDGDLYLTQLETDNLFSLPD